MQPSRIHHVGLPVSDLDLSVAWYSEALGLTHDPTAGVPGGVAFRVVVDCLLIDPPCTFCWNEGRAGAVYGEREIFYDPSVGVRVISRLGGQVAPSHVDDL